MLQTWRWYRHACYWLLDVNEHMDSFILSHFISNLGVRASIRSVWLNHISLHAYSPLWETHHRLWKEDETWQWTWTLKQEWTFCHFQSAHSSACICTRCGSQHWMDPTDNAKWRWQKVHLQYVGGPFWPTKEHPTVALVHRPMQGSMEMLHHWQSGTSHCPTMGCLQCILEVEVSLIAPRGLS